MCIKLKIFLCAFLFCFVFTQWTGALLDSTSNVVMIDRSPAYAALNNLSSTFNDSAGIENDLFAPAGKLDESIQSSSANGNSFVDWRARIHPKKWITEIFAEAQSKFDMHFEVSAACKRDYELYKQNLRNQTIWAIRMMESSEWPRVGLFSGANTHFGHWTTCLRAEGPGIRGRYCHVRATFNFTLDKADKVRPRKMDWPDENASAWRVINMYETLRTRYPRKSLTWTICIPESCTASDLQTSVDSSIRPLFEIRGFNFSVTVSPHDCNVNSAPPLLNGYYTAISFILFMIALVCSATLYELAFIGSEVHGKDFKEGFLLKWFKCFSAIRSWKILTHHSRNTYSILYFMKSICTVTVIFGHTIFWRFYLPTLNKETTEMIGYRSSNAMLLIPNILNVFLVISGFLTTFHFNFSETKNTGVDFLVTSTIIRWLRMIPTFGITLLYLIFMGPHTDNGPIWASQVQREAEYCSSYWWTNVLALNNIINEHKMPCFPASWYIAVDLQLSIIGTALLLILRSNRKLGFLSMALAFVYSLVMTFLIIYWNQLDGCVLLLPREIGKRDSFQRMYMATYFRLGPYLIGCATALLTKWLMKRKIAMSLTQNLAALSSVLVLGIGFQCYIFKFYEVGRPYNSFENAIVGAVNGSLSSLPVAYFICVYFVSGFGILNAVFELRLFTLFSRLSYCVYLVGFLNQFFRSGAQKVVFYEHSTIEIWWTGIGDIIISTLLAMPVFFISEGPCSSIMQQLRKNFV